VGPWPGKWPDGDQWDTELLRDGDRRNVVDAYRYWRHDAIVADLDTHRHDFHVAVENWGHDFNIGSVIRTANAFNAKAFHIVGRRRWNRRGAMVTDRYQHEHHHPTVEDLVAWAASGGTDATPDPTPDATPDATTRTDARGRPRGIPIIGIDNLPGSLPLETYDLPRECVLVFGQEGPGLSAAMREACEVVLHIEQFGSTRSINAGAAAAVAMHAWVRRNIFGQAVD
jgi:tRNA G18 (ribose-2'-O)-methylase SpoU